MPLFTPEDIEEDLFALEKVGNKALKRERSIMLGKLRTLHEKDYSGIHRDRLKDAIAADVAAQFTDTDLKDIDPIVVEKSKKVGLTGIFKGGAGKHELPTLGIATLFAVVGGLLTANPGGAVIGFGLGLAGARLLKSTFGTNQAARDELRDVITEALHAHHVDIQYRPQPQVSPHSSNRPQVSPYSRRRPPSP